MKNGSVKKNVRAKMLCLLLRHDFDLKLTPDLVAETIFSSQSCDTLDAFLTHDPNLAITEPLFLKIFGESSWTGGRERKEFADVLIKHGKKLNFTQGIRDAIDGAYQKASDRDTRQKFYNLEESEEEAAKEAE